MQPINYSNSRYPPPPPITPKSFDRKQEGGKEGEEWRWPALAPPPASTSCILESAGMPLLLGLTSKKKYIFRSLVGGKIRRNRR